MDNFAAIDFETANLKRSSVCSVGIVTYRQGKKDKDFYSLIQPIPNYYSPQCVQVHGISDYDTANAPLLPEVWAQAEKIIGDLPLVAHNRAFDYSCLKKVFEAYGMGYPDYEFYCTLTAAREQLPNLPNHRLDTLSRYFGIKLNHHHALSDAEACAQLALRLL